MSTAANRLFSHFAIGGSIALIWLIPVSAEGKGPQIRFDFPHAVECRDITSKDFAHLYPHERMIEAAFRVSARIIDGHEQDFVELAVVIRSHSKQMRVVEFLPTTTLESEFDGEMEVKETKETIGTKGIRIGAALPIPYGEAIFHGSPSAELGRTNRTTRTETRRTAPPTHVVATSGTMHNEHAVFFKLRPSRNSALEGVHEFHVRFVVPQDWRGDWVQLSCRATAAKSAFSLTAAKPSVDSVCMGLHMAGDIEAQQAAHRLAHAQLQILDAHDESVADRLSLTIKQLFARAKREVSGWVAAIKPSAVASSLPPESDNGKTSLDRPPMTELKAACDEMAMLGGQP